MERTIKDIIRDAEVAYKTWCERLQLIEDDSTMFTTDEKDIIRNAFTQEYEKSRAAAIKELEQKYSNTPIAEINSEKELTIEGMRYRLYNYCDETDCGDCVMKTIDCTIKEMSDTQVITYYNMIEKEH